MRLRRFTGPDTATALRRVKEILGPEAVILATRVAPEGGVEITAAVDADLVTALARPDIGPRDDLAAVVRELRDLGLRVRKLDRALQPAQVGRLPLEGEARVLADRLHLHGLAAELAGSVAASFAQARRGGAPVAPAFAASIARHLLVDAPATGERVTAFVGPTGHGKTTTIAKLAARQLAAGPARIGLVMADTYRVGAAEQLGGYARLLDLPMEIVRDGSELAGALARLADRDTVYVDTAGLGGDPATLAGLRDLLAGAGEPLAVTAVVSAGASERALDGAWQKLATLGPRRCVVTKLDEGGGIGGTCNWLRTTDMALAWLGTGQRVPEDLSVASGETLAHWLVAA